MKLKAMLIGAVLLSVMMLAAACGGSPTPVSSPSPVNPQPSKPPLTFATPGVPAASKPALPTTTAPPTTVPPGATASVKQWSQPPAMQIDAAKQYTAAVETTLGSFIIELFPGESPKTVNNFVFLSREGFYDGIIFHRIIKDFMVQTGDPKGTGAGGPGYRFQDELPPKHKYEPGIVAMANAGPNTNGSQFFICTGASARNLDNMPNYTQFGRVIEGMDVVQKIASVQTVLGSDGSLSKPVNPPVIKSIRISES